MGDRSCARAGRRVEPAVPVVEMQGVTKSFNGVRVLNAVDFALEPGEVHALVGGNGAGKSTLMKILEGVYTLDDGQIEIDSAPVHFSSGLDARRHGLAMIFQEFSLIASLTVAQNVFLTCEPRGPLGTLNDRAAERRARELFAEIGISIDVRARMSAFGTAYWQLTEIAKAMAQDARVLIMDEPTSSLAKSETQALFALIERLKARGIGIVYISHRLEEVFEIADRVTILRDGNVVHSGPAAELTTGRAIELIVGRNVEETLRWRPRDVDRDGQPLLEVRDLKAGPRVRGASFDLYSGEIVGLAGLMGSGRSELAQALFGIERIESGHVRIRGEEVRIRSSRDAIAAGIALIPEDRRIQGLVLDHTVRNNLTLTLLRSLTSHGVLRRSLETDLAQQLADQLGITGGMLYRPVRLLSGGNQQKVVIAKWLGRHPDILIMDEPTAGIDIGTKGEIVGMIRQLADGGTAVILISSEAPELLAASDRILAIHRGAIAGSHDRRDVDDEAALQALIQEADHD
jgi:ribose transport system ATP-binding protein